MLSRNISRQVPLRAAVNHTPHCTFARPISTSSESGSNPSKTEGTKTTTKSSEDAQPPKKKTQAELDKELELKMQGLAGDGGESGVELEDGQPVSMKRSVRNNMFRYI